MLFRIDPQAKTATPVPTVTLAATGARERYDFQEWILATPALLGEELLIVASEFAQFDRSSERIDVLAVDRAGKLVVVELKRTAVGSYADLQAIRYAAYCSTFTLEDVADLFSNYLTQRGQRSVTSLEAAEEIRGFIEAPDFENFDDKPRIILAAEEFPPAMTAALLWLRSFGLDISAVRVQPYLLDGALLLDSQMLIPLPEAEDFVVRKEKKDKGADKVHGKGETYRLWFQPLLDTLRDEHHFTNARVAQSQNWYSFSSGVSGIHYSAAFSKVGLRAEVYIDVGSAEENKRIFDALLSEREIIEREVGASLIWERLDNRRAARIAVIHGAHIDASEEDLSGARQWAAESLLSLGKVFGNRLMTTARKR